ncbi:hypothetical protein [Halorussus litoreus]|uniref:hypothetical protein n=1 Tax=Halorussus litoreus TaxID=1710536 RepID=UPI000E22F706|nr:hypothetical protein [Halorussus litoreus]
MVDTSLAAFRLLELIALLFPVVALLLQLQHRAVDAEELALQGLVTGMGLLMLLSVSFVLVAVYLIDANSMPLLLAMALGTITLLGVQLPVMIVLASRNLLKPARGLLASLVGVAASATVEIRERFRHGSDASDETEEQN